MPLTSNKVFLNIQVITIIQLPHLRLSMGNVRCSDFRLFGFEKA